MNMNQYETMIAEFSYHKPPDAAAGQRVGAVRNVLKDAATKLNALVPDGPQKTLAFRRLQEAMFYSNAAVALQWPTDG